MMINYLYALDHIEMNNQQYLQDGTISVSSQDLGFKRALEHASVLDQAQQQQQSAATTVAAGQIVQTESAKFRLLDITTA